MTDEKRLKDYLLPEFLAIHFEQHYAVNPLLPIGGVGLLHGKGGHGKTQFAFALMQAITNGACFLNRYATAEGRVLYLQFDMPDRLFQERLSKAAPAFARPNEIVIVPYPKPINITETRWQEEIGEMVERHDPMLVVVDTLRKIHPYDENDNAVPSVIYHAWKEAIRNTSVLIIHHDRKTSFGGNTGASEDDPIESFRGARAWIDDSDLGVHLYKYGKKNRIKMDFSKLRCEEQDIMHLQLNSETLLIEPRPPESAREWAEMIRSEDPELPYSEFVKQIIERSGCSKTVAYDTAKSFLEGNV